MIKEGFPAAVWSAVGLAGLACTSSVILSAQRRYYQNTASIQFGKDPSPIKLDHIRDYKKPFADNTRLTRILFGTILMTVMSTYDMYEAVVQLSNNNNIPENTAIYTIISAALVFTAWLYVLALSVASRRYKLPNQWGWILNIHLFIFYMTSLFVSLYRLWDAFRLYRSQISLAQGLPLVLGILFSLDLFYTTGSIDQGPPHLEGDDDNDERTPVAGFTVASIFSILYFNWATPIIDSVNANAQHVLLPSLPPGYRAYNLFYIFGKEREKSLIYRLVHANRPAIVLQSTCTVISAGLYYGPAFFLNKFLNLIQDVDAGKEDEFYFIKGVIIVSGLSLSLVILSIVVGQLYYLSNVYMTELF